MVNRPHKNLEVWKKGMELASLIYRVTAEFPREEIYGLTSQMRRAAVSIPSNIAEGAARFSSKEFLHFLNIAGGSLSELDTQIELAVTLGFIKDHDVDLLLGSVLDISKLLAGLVANIRRQGAAQRVSVDLKC